MRRLGVVVGTLAAAFGCTSEDSTPIDLRQPATTSSVAVPTPHAVGENPEARRFAEQQCHDDPALEQGIIRIVDPVTDEVVGEVVVDCAEVRAGAGAS